MDGLNFMGETNSQKTIRWLIGIIVTSILFIGMPIIISHIITNDRASRDRDSRETEARRAGDEKIIKMFYDTQMENKDMFSTIMKGQAVMQRDISYLKGSR